MIAPKWKTLPDGSVEAAWWHLDAKTNRVVCDLCPRECHLKPGDRGFCFVRENRDNRLVLATYGRSTGFCIDPIEKKPLHHFYPGTSVLSFGTAGCNLGCQFCQNWDISKSRETEKLSQVASPATIAHAAESLHCKSVAYTYNDPVVWAEYAIDTAMACRERNIKNVAVSAGYLSPEARPAFFEYMDAANIDLKGFTEEFYSKITYSHLEPVLETLRYLKHETQVWFEITNLIIPRLNDEAETLKKMCEWIVRDVGEDVPLHFSSFHPDFRMKDRPNTPIETLIQAYDIAVQSGLRYVYLGNVHDKDRQCTYCPNCQARLIERDWYNLGGYALTQSGCKHCGTAVPGRFDDLPGDWGAKRLPINIHKYAIEESARVLQPARVGSTEQTPLLNLKNMSTSSASEASLLDFALITREQQNEILSAASKHIVAAVSNTSVSGSIFEAGSSLQTKQVLGIFVTLKRGKTLRGCCGLLGQVMFLGPALASAAYRTAREDTRMPAISACELPYLSLDVTLLSESEPLKGFGKDLLTQFEIGKDGLRIRLGNHSGLLLPSVPVEQGWSKQEFMEALCRKAGLPGDAWFQSEVQVEKFQGFMMEGHLDQTHLETAPKRAKPIADREQVLGLCHLVWQNILALTQGKTPTYVHPNLPDGNVHGIVLSIFNSATQQPLAHLIRVSLRPGMALQSSLFELSQTAAKILMQSRPSKDIQLELGLTVLHDPAAHGVLSADQQEEPVGLEGIVNAERAVVAMMGGSRVAVSFDPAKSIEDQCQSATQSLTPHGRTVAIYSMEAVSTHDRVLASSTPAAKLASGVRPPAVAGMFYPADDQERRQLVQGFIDAASATRKQSALAIMSPHAGLKYSGRIAADVWSRVSIPESVLIIGPKHTNEGVDWAVAPYRSWQLSTACSFSSDQELAQAIASGVEGMQLDAAAHHREHGIEVQLPILEILAPQTRVAAIAMAGGVWSELQRAASQLASVLRALPHMPLLVISSDMNHYAPETENRRLDRMALDAMLSKNPRHLLDVCVQNQVSMCGVLPAVLVMQTLLELGHSLAVEEVAYTTSAEASGDASRVVGYAGMLIRSAREHS